MDYEKKYKEAFERATQLSKQGGTHKYLVCKIFPELKELEDEWVRKALIHIVKGACSKYGIKYQGKEIGEEKLLAWLEKQGQSKKISIWKHWKDGIAGNGDDIPVFLIKNGLTYNLSSCLSFECDYIKLSDLDGLMLEKQNEPKDYNSIDPHFGKPTDKVEPKFKVGDWVALSTSYGEKVVQIDSIEYFKSGEPRYITSEGRWFGNGTKAHLLTDKDIETITLPESKIIVNQKPADKAEPKFRNGQWIVWQNKCYKVNYNGCGYELIDQNGLSTSLEYGTVEESAYIWDITKDAKDGDVLYLQKDGKEHIIIYKGVIKERFRAFVSAYCAYNGIVDAFCFADVSRYVDIAYGGIVPATKEQRDQLEKAMADAGYTFDFEKKELKKVEQKPTLPGFEQQEGVAGRDYIPVDWVEAIENYGKWKIVRVNEQKPVPKFKVGDIMRTLPEVADGMTDGMPVVVSIDDKYYRCNNELIAIKDQDDYEYPPMNRRQKPTWSEEDDINLGKAIWYVENPAPMVVKGSMLVEWLKSFKYRVQPQNTWKPSAQQMISITCAVRKMKESACYDSVLVSLFNDLKKLREK